MVVTITNLLSSGSSGKFGNKDSFFGCSSEEAWICYVFAVEAKERDVISGEKDVWRVIEEWFRSAARPRLFAFG